MAISVIGGRAFEGSAVGGALSVLNIVIGVFSYRSAEKTEKEAKKFFNKREGDKARLQKLSASTFVIHGTCGTMEWATSASTGAIPRANYFFHTVGKGLSGFLSAVRIYGAVRDLAFFEKESQAGATPAARAYAKRMAVFTCLNMIGDLCMVVLFALELISLLLGFAVMPWLAVILMTLSLLLLTIACIYLCASAGQK